jgi:hypothetical protein
MDYETVMASLCAVTNDIQQFFRHNSRNGGGGINKDFHTRDAAPCQMAAT